MSTSEALRAVERQLGTAPVHAYRLGGEALVVSLEGGGQVVAKSGAGPGATRAEAAGLDWLRESGDVPVPKVHGFDDDWLLLEYVAAGPPYPDAAERFGRGLAALHLRGAPAFGSPPPGGPVDAWMGLAPMRNSEHDDWPTFYARHRIEPYVRTCVDAGLFTGEAASVFDEVCTRLPDLAGPAEPPARLHGDVWSGNVHWADDGQVWLIDPAAHGGHRETDLAMLRLFGTPLLDHILGAYIEAAQEAGAPLADGWRDRVGLHQLFPLLMHAAVFGGGYAREAVNTARGAL